MMMRSASSRFCSCSTTTTTTPTSSVLLLRKKGKRSPNETRFGRRRRRLQRSSSTSTSAEGGGSEEAPTMKNDDDIDRSVDATMMGTTTTRTESTTHGTYIANSKVPKKLEPPKRDTGIPSELDINIDIDEEHTKKTKGVDPETGNSWFRESGVDRGEGGYRCRWTVKGGAAPDKSWEYRETHWEKADLSGYRELGAEKSGFNERGETWWETWRELYNTSESSSGGSSNEESDNNSNDDPSASCQMVERSADKWARHVDTNSDSSREWQEKWWERFSSKNTCDRGVEKSGRENRHAWWEKWGEHYDPNGISLRWTDKWAENDKGVRWGDKWEERLKSTSGDGAKSGETWREQPNGEVWRRTWGEEVFANGEVRKYGESTTDEKWDVTTRTGESAKTPYFDGGKPDTWEEALRKSEKLLNIQLDDDASTDESDY